MALWIRFTTKPSKLLQNKLKSEIQHSYRPTPWSLLMRLIRKTNSCWLRQRICPIDSTICATHACWNLANSIDQSGKSISYDAWPTWDESKLVEDENQLSFKIEGKSIAQLMVAKRPVTRRKVRHPSRRRNISTNRNNRLFLLVQYCGALRKANLL